MLSGWYKIIFVHIDAPAWSTQEAHCSGRRTEWSFCLLHAHNDQDCYWCCRKGLYYCQSRAKLKTQTWFVWLLLKTEGAIILFAMSSVLYLVLKISKWCTKCLVEFTNQLKTKRQNFLLWWHITKGLCNFPPLILPRTIYESRFIGVYPVWHKFWAKTWNSE